MILKKTFAEVLFTNTLERMSLIGLNIFITKLRTILFYEC